MGHGRVAGQPLHFRGLEWIPNIQVYQGLDLFRAQTTEGWSILKTVHTMWQNLVRGYILIDNLTLMF